MGSNPRRTACPGATREGSDTQHGRPFLDATEAHEQPFRRVAHRRVIPTEVLCRGVSATAASRVGQPPLSPGGKKNCPPERCGTRAFTSKPRPSWDTAFGSVFSPRSRAEKNPAAWPLKNAGGGNPTTRARRARPLPGCLRIRTSTAVALASTCSLTLSSVACSRSARGAERETGQSTPRPRSVAEVSRPHRSTGHIP